jgi:trigger factor
MESSGVLQTMMTEAMVQNYLDKKRDDVERIVRLTLAVGDIQKRENIIVDAAELAAEVANSKAEFDRMGQEYDEQRVADQAKEVLEGGKVSSRRYLNT